MEELWRRVVLLWCWLLVHSFALFPHLVLSMPAWLTGWYLLSPTTLYSHFSLSTPCNRSGLYSQRTVFLLFICLALLNCLLIFLHSKSELLETRMSVLCIDISWTQDIVAYVKAIMHFHMLLRLNVDPINAAPNNCHLALVDPNESYLYMHLNVFLWIFMTLHCNCFHLKYESYESLAVGINTFCFIRVIASVPRETQFC